MTFHLTLDNFINDVLDIVDNITAKFIQTGYQAIAHHWLVSGLMISVLTLYVIHFFYQVKYHDIPISDTVTHLIKVCFVYTLATNWDVFYILIYNVATNEPLAISNMLLSTFSSTDGSLNSIFVDDMKKTVALFTSMPFSLKGVATCLIGAALMLISTCLFTLIALGLIVISKFYLAVLLVLAPYFIMMHLFNGTKGLTESWMKEVINKALVPVFVGCVLLLTATLANLCLNVGQAGLAAESKAPDFVGVLLYFVCSILSFFLFKVIPEKAASLTSSLASAAPGRMVSQAARSMGNVASRASKGIQAAKGSFGQRQQKLMENIQQRAGARQQQQEAARAKRAGGGIF